MDGEKHGVSHEHCSLAQSLRRRAGGRQKGMAPSGPLVCVDTRMHSHTLAHTHLLWLYNPQSRVHLNCQNPSRHADWCVWGVVNENAPGHQNSRAAKKHTCSPAQVKKTKASGALWSPSVWPLDPRFSPSVLWLKIPALSHLCLIQNHSKRTTIFVVEFER